MLIDFKRWMDWNLFEETNEIHRKIRQRYEVSNIWAICHFLRGDTYDVFFFFLNILESDSFF